MELTLRRELTVKPADPTWTGTQKLSEFDQIGCLDHTCLIYFYRRPGRRFDEIAEILADSLSRVLVRFYPLAGRLRSIGGGRFELLCNSKGAAFSTAEINATLDSFGDYTTPTEDAEKFLQPEIVGGPEDTPLFLLRLTRFRCGGLSLSLSISHVIADGAGILMFLSELARLARGGALSQAPVLHRTFSRARGRIPRFDRSEGLYPLPSLLRQPGEDESSRKEETRTAMFSLRLTRGQVERLRKMANESVDIRNGARGFSRYESIAAHVWKCSSKARRHAAEQPTACLVTVDSRRRVEPPVPPGYFGNALLDATARCLAGELAASPLGFGAAKIRAAIEGVTSDYVFSVVDYLESEPDLSKYQYSHALATNGEGILDGNPNVNVVNCVDIPLHELDFGWGKATHFGVGYGRADGDSVIIGTPDGDGSVLVVKCLVEEHVESFKKHFYDDMILDVSNDQIQHSTHNHTSLGNRLNSSL